VVEDAVHFFDPLQQDAVAAGEIIRPGFVDESEFMAEAVAVADDRPQPGCPGIVTFRLAWRRLIESKPDSLFSLVSH
jgi:hypothetical protein